MSFLTKMGSALGIKAFSEMRFPGRSFVFFDFPRLETDEIAKEIGDGTGSDIVVTPIRWLQRAFREAPITVTVDGEPVERHELPALIKTPNPFYSSEHLFAGTLFSLLTAGNAYWLKVSNDNGHVKELWWIPDGLIEPKWPDDGKVFISHYKYTVGGQEIKLEPKDVIHFRDGVDPANMRKGLSPLRGLLREIWTDNEAAVFTAALMR
ncbi:MAG: phage portal protein, partial [Proteobacteria bacterium]|nr:phage portal protein [Pseudomonadota bacterium]